MKKIGILTHYQVHNHGAILQMHGLYNVLKNLGLKPVILTYKKNLSFIESNLENKYNISLKSIPFYLGYLRKQGFCKTLFNIKKHKLLNKFKKNNYNFIPLQKEKLPYVVIGSDEVFSLEAGVNIMMYGHTIPAETVFSYAASFGQTDIKRIEEKHCFPLISSGLKALKAISVRDIASANTVFTLTGVKPEICFDPVLLYGFVKELKQNKYKVPDKNYLVVYAYDNSLNDSAEVKKIKAFAIKHNLKIVSPGFYHKWADINLNVNPLELLQVIKKAKYVITDTFHGSVMSILLNTPFAVKLRDKNINKIGYLLESLGASNQKIEDFSDLEKVLLTPVDWKNINKNIEVLREQGMNYLKGVINE